MLGGLWGRSEHRQGALVGRETILSNHTLSLKRTVAEKGMWSSEDREGD